MSSQIFKSKIPDDILINMLENISIKTDKCYVINSNAYKKGIYNGTIDTFINKCIPYYFTSKRKYLEKKITYNSFITIIRQICNFNKFTYTSQIKYDKSNYDIMYYIYI